jgi:hypothetical protein
MAHILFEMLENAGFLKNNVINTAVIAGSRRSNLVEAAFQSAELCSASAISNVGSIFSHTASLSLSGGLLPCAAIDCRTEKAKELAQFAAFYSDRVFINNGLFSLSGMLQNEDLDNARYMFHDELEILLVLRPLIEAGLVVPTTASTNTCLHCLGRKSLPAGEVVKFDNALKRFTKRFEDEVTVTLEWEKSEQVVMKVTGHEDLVEHGSSTRSAGSIRKLTHEHPKLAAELRKEGRVVLPKSIRRKWGTDAEYAHDLFDDIGFEMGLSQCLKTSVVTSRPIEVDILNDVVRSDELNRRNTVVQKYLTCLVPFIENISSDELLALRNDEMDAFISFRQVFAKAIDEHIKLKQGNFSERDAEAVYKEIVEPELARLNQKVKSASNSILKKSRASAIGWTAAITAGFYFGFVQSSLVAAAQALGLTKIAADLAAGVLASSGEDAIRNENMYFLWKIRHRAERA